MGSNNSTPQNNITTLAKRLKPFLLGALANSPGTFAALLNRIILIPSGTGDPSVYPKTAQGMTDALAAASANDQIYRPNGTISGDHTVAADVEVIGWGKNSIFSGTITNNGILTNVNVTGTLVNNGTVRLVGWSNGEIISPRLELQGGLLLNEGSANNHNLIYADSHSSGAVDAQVGGFAAGKGSTANTDGPHFILRGNSFSTYTDQKGLVFFFGGYDAAFTGYQGGIVLGTGPGSFGPNNRFPQFRLLQGVDGVWYFYVSNTAVAKVNNDGSFETIDQFISTVATGTAPLVVASTTLVANLNADLLDGNHASAFLLHPLALEASSILTISSGAVTASKDYHVIAAETGTTDDLATVSGGTSRQLLMIQADTGDTITVKHGTGNIFLNGAADFELSGDKSLLLFYDGTNWSDAGAGGGGGSTTGEIFLTASGGWPSTTNGCSTNTKNEYVTNDVDLYSLDFDQTSIEYAQWTAWMPDDWNGGTVTFKAVWTAAAGSAAQTCEWNLQGRSYADSDAIDQAWGTSVEVSDALLATGDIHYSGESAAITLAGTPAAGELVQFRVWRDATNDTLAADAKLLGVKVYYTKS